MVHCICYSATKNSYSKLVDNIYKNASKKCYKTHNKDNKTEHSANKISINHHHTLSNSKNNKQHNHHYMFNIITY